MEKLMGDSKKSTPLDHTKTVINLLSKTLSDNEKYLLNKGLKFFIATKSVSITEVMLAAVETAQKKIWQVFSDALIKSAEKICGTRKIMRKRKLTNWWSESIKTEIQNEKKLCKTYLKAINLKAFEDYKRQRIKVKELIQEGKIKSWQEFDEEKVLQRSKEYFEELLGKQDDTDNISEDNESELGIQEEQEPTITKEELIQALYKMKLGESPRKDRISAEMLEKLLEMARKMRMNTDTRRDIFYIIVSADDYEDAFEKLMHLGLTKNQEREFIHVILHCCVRENPYNPYYAYLAQMFCKHDRKHMLTLKFSIWDKLKANEKQKPTCMSSLAGLMTHRFLNKGLPISTLKVIEFTQIDNTTTRFLRQIFLGILNHNNTEACLGVFKNVAQSDKLKMFRESLRLFLQIFVRKNFNISLCFSSICSYFKFLYVKI
ncbi:pre-mRNA-splicing factor CWC22-like [Harmonia axyridis]|uniref:pre-mRNA-splicing factor CWC22-like n=1 Tax=Harmonia axyridis TaxID=115357 RepID=UPI001E2795EF|nr:pre-mRNA-splicing factor CWC22-like [Harmonia axyridis]